MHVSTKGSIAVHCLIFIHQYGETKKVTSDLLALSTGANAVTIRRILSALKKDGMISVKFGTGGAALSCPLEEISLYRIYKAIEPDFAARLIGIHPMPSPICPIGKNIHGVLDISYQKVQNDLCESLRHITMADILRDYLNLAKENGSV